MTEHETEPVPGLPEVLPSGETILWQGAPSWTDLAVRVFHVRGVALYFAALFGYLGWAAHADGASVHDAAMAAIRPLPVALLVLGLLAALAYAVARTTLYTVTNRRIVMRFGLALPMTANLPFAQVRSADVATRGATGDIAIDIAGQRQSLVLLWPHVRPWRTSKPQPMLRSLADAEAAAATLGMALRAYHGASATPARSEPAPQHRPASVHQPAAA